MLTWRRFLMSLMLRLVSSINSVPALVLFYSGASHSFISRAFVDKHKLPTVVLKSSMLVSSPGAEMSASLGCCQLSLAIGKHVFLQILLYWSHKVWMLYWAWIG